MRAEQNDAGGWSVLVFPGDDLNEVPASHRELLTPQLRDAFVDPRGYFMEISNRCPFFAMGRWLKALCADNDWHMALHRGIPDRWTGSGFQWYSNGVYHQEISPAGVAIRKDLPATLRLYYSLVDQVRWTSFGYAGGLDGCGEHTPLTNFGYAYRGAEIDAAQTFVMGASYCGDMLIYTSDGRGGWLCHETGNIHLMGTIEDTIEWAYAELLMGNCPEFDSKWRSPR
jgi:hypothetical protein